MGLALLYMRLVEFALIDFTNGFTGSYPYLSDAKESKFPDG